MKNILSIALVLSLLAGAATAQDMAISPSGARASIKGAAEFFTGTATVTPWFSANEHSNATGALVEFTPGARSAWHTHPAGQTLIVTHGAGWVQEDGGKKIEIKPGDVIWTPPGVKHWHGAQAHASMAHITVAPMKGDTNVSWLDHVTDAEYRK